MARSILSLHRFVLGTVVAGEFHVKVHSDSFDGLQNDAKELDNWEIIRVADSIVIAQSKNTSDEVPAIYKDMFGDKLGTRVYEYAQSKQQPTPTPDGSTREGGRDPHMSKLNSDANFIRAIQNWNVNLNAIGAISVSPSPSGDSPVSFETGIIESGVELDNHIAQADNMALDDEIPFAAFDTTTCTCGEPLTIREETERGFCLYCAYDYEKPSPKPTKTTRFTGTGSRGIPNGHGRNRRNAPISRPNRVSKRRKVSTAMMEAKTPKNANKAKQGLTQGLIRQQYAVAQMGYRRQREREMAAAMEHARCMVTINRQMSALGVAA